MQLVTLENQTRQPITPILDHATACVGQCLCSSQVVGTTRLNPESGDLTVHGERRRMPKALTLFPKGRPGSKSEPLPASVKNCPDVARHLRTGALVARPYEVVVIPMAESVLEPPPAPSVEGTEGGAAAPSAPPGDVAPPPTVDNETSDPVEPAGRRARSKER